MATLYTSQTVSSSGGTALLPITATLTKSLVSVHAKVTTGASLPTPRKGFQIVLAATPYTVTDSDGPNVLRPSIILYCEPVQTANGVTYFKTPPTLVEGGNLHCWVNSEALGANVTLDAQVVEIA